MFESLTTLLSYLLQGTTLKYFSRNSNKAALYFLPNISFILLDCYYDIIFDIGDKHHNKNYCFNAKDNKNSLIQIKLISIIIDAIIEKKSKSIKNI